MAQKRLDDLVFECELSIRKLIWTETPPTPTLTSEEHQDVKLPKLSAPTFDGKITSWTSFWEQFHIVIDSRTNISNVEKLAYLRNSLKDGSAKGIIAQSGDYYAEAIATLKARYDRPRLIHQSHIQAILEAPGLKDGTGRDLRKLHDTTQQHLRALKAMGFEPSGPLITSLLELKLDAGTSFEWQKASQDVAGIPHYVNLLEFLNLRAQASEASASDLKKAPTHLDENSWRGSNKPITSFTANTTNPSCCCLCKSEKHHLFACPQFKALPHDTKTSTIKSNGYCINCLRPGHFVKQCRSSSRCRKCHKPHHTLLHKDASNETPSPPALPPPTALPTTAPSTPATSFTANASSGPNSSLLMTCRVLSQAPGGTSIESRALLDSASSISFVSE